MSEGTLWLQYRSSVASSDAITQVVLRALVKRCCCILDFPKGKPCVRCSQATWHDYLQRYVSVAVGSRDSVSKKVAVRENRLPRGHCQELALLRGSRKDASLALRVRLPSVQCLVMRSSACFAMSLARSVVPAIVMKCTPMPRPNPAGDGRAPILSSMAAGYSPITGPYLRLPYLRQAPCPP